MYVSILNKTHASGVDVDTLESVKEEGRKRQLIAWA